MLQIRAACAKKDELIYLFHLNTQLIMMLKKVAYALALGTMLVLGSCAGKQNGHDHSHDATGAEKKEMPAGEVDKSGPEYTSAYICPMHCPGSGSDQPGQCPKCGMDYVKNEDVQSSEEGHEGHDHSH